MILSPSNSSLVMLFTSDIVGVRGVQQDREGDGRISGLDWATGRAVQRRRGDFDDLHPAQCRDFIEIGRLGCRARFSIGLTVLLDERSIVVVQGSECTLESALEILQFQQQFAVKWSPSEADSGPSPATQRFGGGRPSLPRGRFGSGVRAAPLMARHESVPECGGARRAQAKRTRIVPSGRLWSTS